MPTKRTFTTEQQELLRRNPYTIKVTASMIKFTLAFKEYFYKKTLEGEFAEDIFFSCGYDPDLLGPTRIRRFRQNILEQANSPEGLREGSKKRRRYPDLGDYKNMPPDEAMKHMQNEILYLHQELDFLKKIYLLGKQDGSQP